MTPNITVDIERFRQDPGLVRVMDALGDGKALMVGGCVRAAILGEGVGDIDIATQLTPPEVTQILENAGIRVVPTGVEHGTVTAVTEKRGYEITTLRRDVETDGRRAVVAFSTDWLEDAERRDFTMNTLLMDMKGQVFDPTGTGVADLKSGVVRFVGNADMRIKEDALRILRFFRFHARYGQGSPNVSGYEACVHNVALLETLSRERITQEVEKLLVAPGAASAIMSMIAGKVLVYVWQKNWDASTYKILQNVAVKLEDEARAMCLLMYCMKPENADILDEKIARYFVLSNRKKEFLHQCLNFILNPSESLEKNIYHFGREVTLAGSILSSVFKDKNIDLKNLETMVEAIAQAPLLKLPISAKDLIQHLKMKEGKQLGDILRAVESWWLENGAVANAQQCLDRARTLL